MDMSRQTSPSFAGKHNIRRAACDVFVGVSEVLCIGDQGSSHVKRKNSAAGSRQGKLATCPQAMSRLLCRSTAKRSPHLPIAHEEELQTENFGKSQG
eukprot:83773-Pelagomonas_calceolata.AAC.1